jgi:hypothetical protein
MRNSFHRLREQRELVEYHVVEVQRLFLELL